jgi:FkbM family methyltransferase
LHIRSRAKIAVRHALRQAGFDLVRSLGPDDLLRRRIDLLRRHGINVLFDVGANTGQYGSTMRALGYEGRIISFEPSSEAFRVLADTTRGDPSWTALNCALGEREGEVALHVSANSQSSSVLPMLPSHVAAAPDSVFVAEETVECTTLGSQIKRHVNGAEDRLFVKVDTQGSELQVLAGAEEQLGLAVGLQLELSLIQLYEGQPVIEELISAVRALGYIPVAVEPDFFDPHTGRLLQADGIFFRP